MKKTVTLTVLLLALTVLFGTAYGASGETDNKKKSRLEKLAVFDLEAKWGVENGFAEGLSIIVRDTIYSFGVYEVMSQADLQAVASREQLRQAMGCDDDENCLINFGRNTLGTRYMVAGAITKYGSTYTVSLRMLDTKGESAGLVNRVSESCKCSEDALIETVKSTTAKLVGKKIPAQQEKADARIAEERLKTEAEKQKLADEVALLKKEQTNIAAAAAKKTITVEKKKQLTSTVVSMPPSGSTYTDPTTGMEFVYVKGGCFQMGDTFGDGGSDEQPVHEVCVDGFYMGKYEVTQGEYQKITGSNPSRFKNGSNYPVEKVSWYDAQDFISKLNSRSGKTYRLPTEAEWEYAARSGGKREKYSGSSSPDSVAWYSGNSGNSTHPVGRKSPNGLGLYELSGNVWEWCADWYDGGYYSLSPRNNPQGASSGSRRVLRGGGWGFNPRFVQTASRRGFGPGYRLSDLGFRLVLSEGS